MIIELTEKDLLPRAKGLSIYDLNLWNHFRIDPLLIYRAEEIFYKDKVFKKRGATI